MLSSNIIKLIVTNAFMFFFFLKPQMLLCYALQMCQQRYSLFKKTISGDNIDIDTISVISSCKDRDV